MISCRYPPRSLPALPLPAGALRPTNSQQLTNCPRFATLLELLSCQQATNCQFASSLFSYKYNSARGWGYPLLCVLSASAFSFSCRSLFSTAYALFCAGIKVNSFLFNAFRTLWQKHPGGGGLARHSFTRAGARGHSSLATSATVPLRRGRCGARMEAVFVNEVLETTPLPPVSNQGERTAGSACARRRPRLTIPGPLGSKIPATESQVVPGFAVLSKGSSYRAPETADRIAGWLASI